MHEPQPNLIDVISGFYGAALGDRSWNVALRDVAGCFGGAGAALFNLNRRTGEITDWIDHGLDPGRDEYAARINRINPRMRFSLAHAPGHVAWDACFISERDMRRHEFYDWARRIAGVRYFVGSRLLDAGELSTFTSIEFTPAHGPVSEHEIQRYRLVARHLATAWGLHSRTQRARSGLDVALLVSDTAPWGIIALDGTGRILETNPEAQRILTERDGLRLDDGRLHASNVADDRKLQTLLANSVRSARLSIDATSGAVMLARPSGLPGYGVQILPVVRGRDTPTSAPAAILYVSDLASQWDVDPEDLRALFGLSRREADLAAHLGSGRSLAEAADRMRISRNTARNHLQSIFCKTETHGQNSLVRLMTRLFPR
ncbi:helix-turn-helix transcriptional regulator [Thioalkalivibrio thiocyanodenitrificans]|uniref:helix-turn-helix transcriptional regulator n=1 Tax=Thioalkalivibrio thiocyanodenitrificans TaxID=243063 RepID=UPI0006855057|nr:helix-turn-helix transcriptional regulator [Thioalkalivibrio thiocyanodenitrificans]